MHTYVRRRCHEHRHRHGHSETYINIYIYIYTHRHTPCSLSLSVRLSLSLSLSLFLFSFFLFLPSLPPSLPACLPPSLTLSPTTRAGLVIPIAGEVSFLPFASGGCLSTGSLCQPHIHTRCPEPLRTLEAYKVQPDILVQIQQHLVVALVIRLGLDSGLDAERACRE